MKSPLPLIGIFYDCADTILSLNPMQSSKGTFELESVYLSAWKAWAVRHMLRCSIKVSLPEKRRAGSWSGRLAVVSTWSELTTIETGDTPSLGENVHHRFQHVVCRVSLGKFLWKLHNYLLGFCRRDISSLWMVRLSVFLYNFVKLPRMTEEIKYLSLKW